MRLTVVAAAAGYGKTSTVRRTTRDARWCAGEAAADFIRTRRWAPSVVLDEPEVSFEELRSWLATTPCERVTVITREPLEGATLGPADLALPEAAVGSEVYAATKGWPALALRWPEHADYVRSTVLPSLSVAARKLVTTFARLGPVRRALCTELGVDPVTIAELTRLGVLRDGALVPAVADGVDEESTVDQRRAASWYARNGFPAAAARLYHRLGLHRCLDALLAERGREVLEADPETFGRHPLLAAPAHALAAHHLGQAHACLAAARYPQALTHADLAVHLTGSPDAVVCRGRVLGRLGGGSRTRWRASRRSAPPPRPTS